MTPWDVIKAGLIIYGVIIAIIVAIIVIFLIIVVVVSILPRKDPLAVLENQARQIAKKDLQVGRRKNTLRAGKVTRNKTNSRIFYVEFVEPHVTVTVNIEDKKVVAKRWHS